MKRDAFLKLLKNAGFVFVRNGGAHDIYVRDGKREAVPRHNEIAESLVNAILKRNNISRNKRKQRGV